MFTRERLTFEKFFKIFGTNSEDSSRSSSVTTTHVKTNSVGCPSISETDSINSITPIMRLSSTTTDVMDYHVRDCDTIEGIAASHDCTVGELVKLNKMHSRMVFPGQKIMVPMNKNLSNEYSPLPTNSPTNKSHFADYSFPDGASQSSDLSFVKPPGQAIRQNLDNSDASNISLSSRNPLSSGNESIEGNNHVDSEDTDCLRRFLKVKVKQVTESDGTVTGTLLITPNCMMFDPDLNHPLVKENGPDLYGMVANMDDIVSVSVFKHAHALVEERNPKPSFDLDESKPNVSFDNVSDVFTDSETSTNGDLHEPVSPIPPTSLTMSKEQQLPSIEEESHLKGQTPDTPASQKNLMSTKLSKSEDSEGIENKNDENDTDRPRAHSDLQPSTSLDSKTSGFSRFSPSMTRRSFGRLGRTLSNRANSIKGTVTSGAQSVASGTQKVAHGVVTHTKSAADHIQSGIQTGAKAVASVPGSLVNVGTGILQEGQDLYGSFVAELKGNEQIATNRIQASMKREKSLATLESLRQKTHEARTSSMAQNMDQLFTNASTNDEFNELFKPIELIGQNQPIGTPPEPPCYMTIRVDRRRMTKNKKINYDDALGNTSTRHASVSSAGDLIDQPTFGNKRRCEFWFAIPKSSAEAIYHFLIIWSPAQHGTDEQNDIEHTENQNEKGLSSKIGNKKGLIVITSTNDSEDDKITSSKKIDDGCWFNSFGHGLIRDWEIVTVRELCRRLSLEEAYDISEIPLPEGSLQSQILDEFMIRQLAEILPPRAEGYPWVLIYSSEKHGFSLTTMYRKMEKWIDEMSPILLIIRDIQGHVFGAMTSNAFHPCDHYYGTADSCFLFRFTGKVPHTRELRHYEWTGENQFFINATKETLSIGAGSGHSGLWLDADLNHGRSQRCKTFENEPLAGGNDEDFVIQFVEAFGFTM
uniref:Oxidation resistance protein 1 n=1 Tax=Panagrolaimus sp. JU765 TaxID=591449 RepID=A0AC34PZE5_9BILA